MAGTSREISSVMTSAANNYNTRLDSSVRIKTRKLVRRTDRASTTPWLRSAASIVARHAITHSAATTMYFRRVLEKVKMSISAAKF